MSLVILTFEDYNVMNLLLVYKVTEHGLWGYKTFIHAQLNSN